MTLEDVQARLHAVSSEIKVLIRNYNLDAISPLAVIDNARQKIEVEEDYIRFLELSLEGRILADEGERLMKIQRTLS